jgi:transcriptional regulator with XRE-family HTH domain
VNKIDLTRLGHTIRFLRQGKGWTLADLAEKSGVSKAYISDLENASAGKPNIQYVFSVANALDTTLDRILDHDSGHHKPETRTPVSLPPGLAELRQQFELSDDDVERLSSINFRGHRPRDADGWRYLLETLKMLGQRRSEK